MISNFTPRNVCARIFALVVTLIPLSVFASMAAADMAAMKAAWPRTDFDKTTIDLSEIQSGGIPKDHIPAIDTPTIGTLAQGADVYDPREPVIAVTIDGKTRGYPLTILTWHEIVNDQLAGVPITVTYCPLCNSAVVFDRRLGDRVLDFGTTGNLRFSDLVMYDRQTESWWQQFTGIGNCWRVRRHRADHTAGAGRAVWRIRAAQSGRGRAIANARLSAQLRR